MKGLEMVKCKSLRINMLRITHTGKSVNFPVTEYWCYLENMRANSQRKEYPCKIQNAQFVCFILSQFRSNFVTWMT